MKNEMPIRCVVVDDEPLATKLLVQYVSKTPGLELQMKTTRANEALKQVQDGNVDLIFLDIRMPEMNGIELMKIIRKDCHVVLTTAYPEYALEGFEHDIIDYLLKPITYDRFLIAVNKIKERLHKEPKILTEAPQYIFIKSGHRIRRITFSSILYIEALRDYIAFHTNEEKILSLENMKNMEEVLPPGIFTRIHKSFIINKSKIEFIEKWKIIINKQYLPVGETYRKKLVTELKA
ncbi:MAG: response regulator transcription factor [Bacteroidetes bacterium]|nr:MAG: response regulator transcription factor [Bacteroidota bacterium]